MNNKIAPNPNSLMNPVITMKSVAGRYLRRSRKANASSNKAATSALLRLEAKQAFKAGKYKKQKLLWRVHAWQGAHRGIGHSDCDHQPKPKSYALRDISEQAKKQGKRWTVFISETMLVQMVNVEVFAIEQMFVGIHKKVVGLDLGTGGSLVGF